MKVATSRKLALLSLPFLTAILPLSADNDDGELHQHVSLDPNNATHLIQHSDVIATTEDVNININSDDIDSSSSATNASTITDVDHEYKNDEEKYNHEYAQDSKTVDIDPKTEEGDDVRTTTLSDEDENINSHQNIDDIHFENTQEGNDANNHIDTSSQSLSHNHDVVNESDSDSSLDAHITQSDVGDTYSDNENNDAIPNNKISDHNIESHYENINDSATTQDQVSEHTETDDSSEKNNNLSESNHDHSEIDTDSQRNQIQEQDAHIQEQQQDGTITSSSTSEAEKSIENKPVEEIKVETVPTKTNTINDDINEEATKVVKVNYASKSIGAIIMEKSPNFKGTSNLLVDDNDLYAIVPCKDEESGGNSILYVTVGLPEEIQIKSIKLSSYERYSSTTHTFQILGSQTMTQWEDLGTFEAKNWFKGEKEQVFELNEPSWARYLKFRFLKHYNEEHYCTLTQIQVFGNTALQGFHEMQMSRDKDIGKDEEYDDDIDESMVEDQNEEEESLNSDDSNTVITNDHIPNETTANHIEETVDTSEENKSESDSMTESETRIDDGELKSEDNMIQDSNQEIDSVQTKDSEVVSVAENTDADNSNEHPKSSLHSNDSVKSNMMKSKLLDSTDDNENVQNEIENQNILSPDESNGSALQAASIKTSSSKAHNVEGGKESAMKSGSSVLNMIKATIGIESTKNVNATQILDNDVVDGDVDSITVSEQDDHKNKSDDLGDSIENEKVSSETKLTESDDLKNRSNKTVVQEAGIETIVTKEHEMEKDTQVQGASSQVKESSQSDSTNNIIKENHPENASDPSKSDASVPMKVTKQEKEIAIEESPSSSTGSITTNNVPISTSSTSKQSSSTKTESTSTSSSNKEHVVNETLQNLQKMIPNASCLQQLDFNTFKSSKKKKETTNVNPGSASSSSKNEPIFKKLTDEITVLENNQGIYDQYIKLVTNCYQTVLFELMNEMKSLKNTQEQRMLSLEEQLQMVLSIMQETQEQRQNEDEKDEPIFFDIEYRISVCYKILKQIWSLFTSGVQNAFQTFIVMVIPWLLNSFAMTVEMVLQSEQVQHIIQAYKMFQNEIISFLAGILFCFIIILSRKILTILNAHANNHSRTTQENNIMDVDVGDDDNIQNTRSEDKTSTYNGKNSRRRRKNKGNKAPPPLDDEESVTESFSCGSSITVDKNDRNGSNVRRITK